MNVVHTLIRRRMADRGHARAAATVGLCALLVSQALLSPAGAAQAAPASPTPAPSAPSPTPQPPTGAAGSVTWGVAPANNDLGTNRARFTYTVPAGSQILDAMTVVNRSAADITLRAYASDAFTTTSGVLDLLPATEKPVDIGSWVTVKQPTVTLKPQQAAVVPFTLTIPANATPGDHTGGLVTSLVTNEQRTSINLDRRLGSRIYLRVLGPLTPALDIGDVRVAHHGTINPAAGGSTTVTYTVTNSGNVRLQARQSVRVTGPWGILGHTTALGDLPEILPGNSLTRAVTVHGVWPATRLTATVRLQPYAGPDSPPTTVQDVTGSGKTWGWPYGQALAIVLIVGAVLASRWLRRRHKAKIAAAIAAAVAAVLKEKDKAEISAESSGSLSGSSTAPSRTGPAEQTGEPTDAGR